jgi:hypothetical protein
MNPLEQAIKSGIKANDTIGDLIADIGTKDHPRGFVTSAYRNARRSMVTALKEQNRLEAVTDVLGTLRRSLSSETASLFRYAQEQGADESARQMRFYGITSPDVTRVSMDLSTQNQSAVDAVLAKLDAQASAIRAAVVTNQGDEQIIGDEDRVGIFRASDVVLAAAFWGTALVWDAFDYWTNSYSRDLQFQKQAVAALDSKTTDCCLHVHAQVQPFNKPFHLTGTPRFADYVDWPAFHWYCRTAGVLYLPEFDDGLSAKMRQGADWFLNERAAGRSPNRSPADAY